MKRERIIRPLIASFTLLLGAIALTGCATKPGVAAEVNGEVITEAQVETATSELGEFYRELGSKYAPVRIEAVDALIFKEVANSQKGDEAMQMGKIDADDLRKELKKQIEASCQEGKAQVELLKDNPDMATNEQKNQFKTQVQQTCDMKSKVDDLSDDAVVVNSISDMKKKQGLSLTYPILKEQFPDTKITVAHRYGEISDAGLQRNVPRSVFFVPRQ